MPPSFFFVLIIPHAHGNVKYLLLIVRHARHAWQGGARHRRQSPNGERCAAASRRNGERRTASSRRSRAALCLRGGGGRSRCAPYFRKKYRLLLTERAVCVIMRPKIVRCGLFLAKECRQILSARRVLPPSAGSCAYLCGSVAAGSAAGKPLRRLQLHRFAWRTYLSLVEYRSASMLIYIDVGGGVLCFLLEIKEKAPPCGAAYRIGARRARTARPLWTTGIAVP